MSNDFNLRYNTFNFDGRIDDCKEFISNTASGELLKNGAVLLRATGIENETQLDEASSLIIKNKYSDYLGGVVPRSKESKKVFNSTELNKFFKLKLHNELAYQPNFPRYIGFFCFKSSLMAGQTPIAHEQDIQRYLGDELIKDLEKIEVRYNRRYLSSDRMTPLQRRLKSIFLSWQDSFGSTNRQNVEITCERLGLSYKWDHNDSLLVESTAPLLKPHPEKNKTVFVNQFLTQQYSKSGLGLLGYYSQRILGIRRHEALRDSRLLNSELNDREVAKFINRAHKKSETQFDWKEGDFLLLDNLQVLHGRKPYLGKRKISVVMGD